MKINFYHLKSLPIGKALPKLLEKVISANFKVMIQAPSEEMVRQLNRELWTYTTKFFLPHGTKEDGFASQQPIFITANNDNANEATILALVSNSSVENMEDFEKCIYMFDGNDEEQVKNARLDWKKYSSLGHDLIYWQQTPKGIWQEMKS